MTDLPRQDDQACSAALFLQAQRSICGGVNSPVRAFGAVGGTPPFIQSAKAAELVDEDGNRYIDYVGSWGPMVLGHADPRVLDAVIEAAQEGLSFGAPCQREIALAELVCERVPSIERLRMVSSGTEATMSAIRVARGFTGRDKIIKFEGCYHGHADSLLVKAGSGALTFQTPSSAGVPAGSVQDTLIAQYNDLDSVAALMTEYPGQIAAVIIEPVAGNMNLLLPLPSFLPGLRSLCDQHGALLIFDEVMTGFRLSPAGYQGLTDVVPDMTALGKIIGGGLPVGAFGGREEVMAVLAPNGPVYQAGTLSGNPVAMAAGFATLSALQPECYARLDALTERLCVGISQSAVAAGIPVLTQHVPGMFGVFFTDQSVVNDYAAVLRCHSDHFKRFFHGMLAEGIYMAPSSFEAGFVSLAHDEDLIDQTVAAAARVFARF